MNRNLFLAFFMLFSIINGKAQFIDKYGIAAGASWSNQHWDYKLVPVDDPDYDYKAGLSVFLSAEKELNRFFNLRSEFGYIQKGLKNRLEFYYPDGTTGGTENKNLILHNLGFNMAMKIIPLDSRIRPYALLGLGCDYRVAFRDIIIEEPASGLEFPMFGQMIEKFSKANLVGLMGAGVEINDLVYIEILYNPSITRNYNTAALEIRDVCWEIKAGMNINRLIK